jgi:DNA-binding response OmpR family regulator
MLPHTPILLIDDNRSWLEALADFLRSRGLPIVAVDDPEVGLSLLESREWPLAVVDLHMPGMDGLELLRRVRARQCTVPVVMMTSDDEPATRVRAKAEGVGEFVAKTAPPAMLLRTVRKALEANRREAESPLWQRLLPAPQRAVESPLLQNLGVPRLLLAYRR